MIRKVFVLGGSNLQLDLLFEAKQMFFYTVVLDRDAECVGAKWCDEFICVDIADKKAVLALARKHRIDAILTSATELGNLTACWVGEQLNLRTNTYETALNTTNKKRMKEILGREGLPTAHHRLVSSSQSLSWTRFPCIIKPYDSSAGRGLSYVRDAGEMASAIDKALSFSRADEVLVEEYIAGKQYSVETISCKGVHQIVCVNEEVIRGVPDVLEVAHHMPAMVEDALLQAMFDMTYQLLFAFGVEYGACHVELRVTEDNQIYVVELASRTGGMRSEMISLSQGVSYSQLLLLAAMGILGPVETSRNDRVSCYFVVDYSAFLQFQKNAEDKAERIFCPFEIPPVEEGFVADNLGDSKGYYYVLARG